ncbi:hypothetical protein NDU88_000516 [Pleurodeles waltl]|uniref:Uncharacterized protein n=1 Tax=Pleurodeles waltl TaxID=8319 RepID=A0AAV7WFQ6_PLEWA|nr:hypothetical protein NDU88_000516 [Pleurodeles waltl]
MLSRVTPIRYLERDSRRRLLLRACRKPFVEAIRLGQKQLARGWKCPAHYLTDPAGQAKNESHTMHRTEQGALGSARSTTRNTQHMTRGPLNPQT